MPGSSLIVPTVYSVTAAAATIARPGLGGDPSRDAGPLARVVHRRAPLGDRRRLLALDVGDAEAATDRQLGQPEVVDERGQHLDRLVEEVGDEHLAADVHVHADEVDGHGRRRLARWPVARPPMTPKPNFESSWPVRTNSWVCASTPGVMRSSTVGAMPSSACRTARCGRARRSCRPRCARRRPPAPCAARPTTCCCRAARADRPARPAASATCSSPPVATSRCMPSSCARRAMARQRNAFVA